VRAGQSETTERGGKPPNLYAIFMQRLAAIELGRVPPGVILTKVRIHEHRACRLSQTMFMDAESSSA
jgi:hypothetical protein